MNKRYFRNISIVTICSLLLLAGVQSYWVYRMYKDSVTDFTRRVESATYKSIYKAFRMDAIPGITAAEQINIDLDRFALYFEPNLLELDALQPYRVEVVDAATQRTMMVHNSHVKIDKPLTTSIVIDDDSLFVLRLAIEIPYAQFWSRMWGIILSSVAIIVVLGAVLVYLIRTMFRQKSLEQMRRDFTHNITHELKTPISVAIAATDALRNFSADSDAERRSRYLGMVEQQLSQLSTMVERILSVSVEGQQESYNPEPLDIVQTLFALKKDMEINSDRLLTIRIISPEKVVISADKFHIQNMLATILDNAVKYSAEHPVVTAEVVQRDKFVLLSISDNGCGIAHEHLKHIFEKFYRVPNGERHTTRGYGLGLYYARKVAEMHNGEITAHSRVGIGTTITIKLPADGAND